MRSSVISKVVLVVLLTLASLPAQGNDKLRAEIEAVINQPIYKHAHWGILIVDLASGKTLYEHNADKLFVPASTTKLFTVASALDALGVDYRFQTPVVRRGAISPAGELNGDLILVAGGDLTMGGRADAQGRFAFKDTDHTYANGGDIAELTEPNPLAGLHELARQVAAAGIRHVRGNVLVDDRLFDSGASTGSGPTRLSPIMVNDNVIDILITPGTEGQPATVTTRPLTSAYVVDAQVVTAKKGGEPKISILSPSPGRVLVRGEIPAGRKPLLRIFEVHNAPAFARTLFIEALRRAGVTVGASPLAGQPTQELPPRAEVEKLPRVAVLTSAPFAENVKLILKVSHNLHASTLPLLVAAKQGKRTLEDGLRRQHAFLAKAGVDVETISFGGGAGGSRADLTTPRATVQLLRYMATRPDFATYETALPRLGVDGTLAKVVQPNSPARDKVHAKTGTLLWKNVMNDRFLLNSKALAGYLTTSQGRRLAFAMFVNDTHMQKASDSTREGKTLGRLCEIIYRAE